MKRSRFTEEQIIGVKSRPTMTPPDWPLISLTLLQTIEI